MTRPLAGRRVAVTRCEQEDGPLTAALRRAGAEPILIPLIGTVAVNHIDETAPLAVRDFDWIAFTSANGVREFWKRLDDVQRDSLRAHRAIAVVGPATAHAIATLGATPALIAPEFVAESLANAFGEVTGKRVLWPRAAGARSVLSDTLRERGAEVRELVLYDTVPLTVSSEQLDEVERADAVTFASPSAVRAFVACFGARDVPLVACIGPVTASAAREAGLPVQATASVFTLDGLVGALASELGTGAVRLREPLPSVHAQ